MRDATVLFVGESPPPGAPAGFRPFDCASGTRLARHALGLVDRAALLDHVPLVNLFDRPTGPKGTPAWQPAVAEEAAFAVCGAPRARACKSVVMLGSRVAEAFRCGHLPGPISSTIGYCTAAGLGPVVVVRAPHPSGASTVLNDAGLVREVRRALLPELVLGVPTLRPWHFRLDDPAVLEDVALVVAPLRPSAGLVALEHAASQYRTSLASPPGSLLARIRDLAGEAQVVRAGVPPESLPGDDHREAAPAWDEPLARTAAALLRPGGVEDLSERWDPDGATRGPRTGRGRKSWLAARVLGMDAARRRDLDALGASHAARATVLRYHLGGLS